MGTSLIKKFLGRKDFVMVMASRNPAYDEEDINSFFEQVHKERGKIIKIESMLSIQSNSDYEMTGREGVYTDTENNYLIHYKCHKRIKVNQKP